MRLVLLFLCAASLWAQYIPPGGGTGNGITNVTSLPATCTASGSPNVVFLTTGTVGPYACLAPNTWTFIGTGGNTPGVAGYTLCASGCNTTIPASGTTIAAATHGQGLYPFIGECLDGSGIAMACNSTVNTTTGALTLNYSSAPSQVTIVGATGGFANPLTTLGDLMYENATPAPTRLAGNTTSALNVLTQTGTGSVSAAPAWTTLATAGIAPSSTAVTASSPGVGIAHFAGSTQAVTSSTIVAADIAANTITSGQVNNSIALTGTDINTSNQVTATHLAAPLPLAQGGTNCATPYAINPQTTTYQVVAVDFTCSKTISVASGTFTITLVASGSQPVAGSYIQVVNYGSGVVTIARSGQNINGGTSSLTLEAASATIPSDCFIQSDGTNYFASCGAGNALTTQGDLSVAGVNGIPSRLAVGGATTLLHGGASTPAYSALALADTPLTTRGDLLVANSTPALGRLAIGAANTVLHGSATDPTYSAVVGGDFGSSIAARAGLNNATAAAAAPTFSTTADFLAYQVAEIPQVVFMNADFTTSGVGTALEAITGLTWTLPGSTALNVSFSCHLIYHQNSAAAAVAFGTQNATTAPTNYAAKGVIYTSASVFAAANVVANTATTAVSVVSGTPSAITTNWNADLDGLIEQPSGTASVFTIRVSTATAADTVTVKRGSFCRVN
ncbi:MAG TPA: hypothetical protein VKQ11_00360 [Candidatus Sulfotelmatobacter sp.]|nr:hypothetical protein [Candidatus Sulfotelmatobacter sp.]